MTRYACWLEPVIINDWCNLMADYDSKVGRDTRLDKYRQALSWLDEERETREVRAIFEHLRATNRWTYCVWTGKRLRQEFHIDHCFPFAHWPNNDLWNLLPADPVVNSSKSNKLPSAEMLEKARESILEWWNKAYSSVNHMDRFVCEADAALPVIRSVTGGDYFCRTFAGVQNQRIRLKTDQQIAEWNGL